MAKMQNNVLNVSKVVACPVLIGRTDLPLWTGVVSSKRIDQYLIPNSAIREDFIKLVKSFEKDIIEYRRLGEARPSALLTKTINLQSQGIRERELLDNIRHKTSQIKAILNNPDNGIDMDLFWVMLCQDYEEILKRNSAEFSHMDKEAEKSLKDFYRIISERPILLREVYVESSNEYMTVTFPTESQEKRLKRGNKNPDKLVALVKAIYGKENISQTEGMELLEEMFESVLLTDFFTFFSDAQYAELAYITLFKNYLIKIGFNKDEIQAMSQDELSDTVFQTYNTTGLKHHKGLVAKTIKEGIYFCDLNKLMLIAAARHLNSYEEIRVVQGVESDTISKDSVIKKDISAELETGEITDLTSDFVAELSEASGNKIMHAFNDEAIIKRMRISEIIIREILKQKLILPSTTVSLIVYNSEYVEFSKRKIEEMLTKYCDGIYLTDILQTNLIYKAFLTPGEMAKWSPELVQRINFKDKDLIILTLSDFVNLKILHENGKIDKNQIMSMLQLITDGSISEILNEMREIPEREADAERMLENSSKLLSFLVSERIIDIAELKEFYDKRVIKMEDLEALEKDKQPEERDSFVRKLGDSIDSLEVLRVYKDYIEHKLRYEKAVKENDPDVDIFRDTMEIKRREKDIQVMLFSKYKLANLSEEERKDFMDEWLLTYCLEFEYDDEAIVPETLRQMYKDGIVKFEEISSISNEYLQTVIIDLMFVRGELSLDDTKKLRNILSLEALVAIINAAMVNPAITQTQKVSLIMNIFHNGIEDQEIADKFLSQLHAEHYVGVEYKELIKDKKTKHKDEKVVIDGDSQIPPKDPSKEWVYPKYVKWEFLNALDKDAMITVYANGYVEAYSRKLGVRIIEKYFETTKETNQFGKDAYGYATFNISENRYIENLDMLVDSHSRGELLLNHKTLSLLVTDKSDRIRHNTHSIEKNWMRTMSKRFDIDLETDIELVQDSRYTKEELQHLRDIIKKYENLYIDRNAER